MARHITATPGVIRIEFPIRARTKTAAPVLDVIRPNEDMHCVYHSVETFWCPLPPMDNIKSKKKKVINVNFFYFDLMWYIGDRCRCQCHNSNKGLLRIWFGLKIFIFSTSRRQITLSISIWYTLCLEFTKKCFNPY